MWAGNKIAVVIVTYNRADILKDCITAIRAQSVKPDEIIVINNGSTDHTKDFLDTQSDLDVTNKNNDGSAGAYYAGMKRALEIKADYIWLMDDDGIANADALEQLLDAIKIVKEFSFLYCKIISKDDIFMNAPTVDNLMSQYNYPVWGQYAEHAIIAIKSATYISLFINAKNLRVAGLPCKDFYFWADDLDFTARLYKTGPAFMIGKSVVKHLRTNPNAPSILSETEPRRIQLHFYNIRNTIYLARRDNSTLYVIRALLHHVNMMFKCFSTTKGSQKASIYCKGIFAGLFFNPSFESCKV